MKRGREAVNGVAGHDLQSAAMPQPWRGTMPIWASKAAIFFQNTLRNNALRVLAEIVAAIRRMQPMERGRAGER